jgi:two-component system sensor histidine kinase UhpB
LVPQATVDLWWILAIGSAMFLVLAGGIIALLLLHVRKTTKLLSEARLMQEQLSSLSQQILTAQEEDRLKVSRELHDEIGQLMAAIDINLTVLKKEFHAGPSQQNRRIDVIRGLTQDVLTRIRKVLKDLRPVVLEGAGGAGSDGQVGILEPLRRLCSEHTSLTGIPVSFLEDEAVEQLSEAHKIALYRIIQESLTNITKHAQAQHAVIEMTQDQDESTGEAYLDLAIQDDGCGFESESETRPPNSSGRGADRKFGLLGIRERVKSFGGTCNIASVRGKGTRVSLRIPLNQTSEGKGKGSSNG